jgi:hypothetical protein
MKSAIYMDGKRFIETEFKLEEDFERVVKEHSKTLFGDRSINGKEGAVTGVSVENVNGSK